MRRYQFNPYDSNTWEGMSASNSPMPDDSFLYDSQAFEQNAQPLPYQLPTQVITAPPIQQIEESPESDDYSSYSSTPIPSPPHVITSSDSNSIILSDLRNFKTALAARSGYLGPQMHHQWVKHELRGFICLPLNCCGYIRQPHGEHKHNPAVLIYQPLNDQAYFYDKQYYRNFTDCLEYLEKLNQSQT